jgi:hypothetical protein
MRPAEYLSNEISTYLVFQVVEQTTNFSSKMQHVSRRVLLKDTLAVLHALQITIL